MIHRIINGRLFAIALLVIAHLSITLHAADHGAGQHAHDNVPCLVGTANEDDVLAPPPSAVCSLSYTGSAAVLVAEPFVVLPEAGVLLPPATGPPVTA